MKRFGRALLVSVIASSLAVSSVMAAPSVDELKRNKQSAEKEVKKLEDQLTDVMVKINNMEEKLVQKGQDIIETTEKLKKAEKKEKKQYEDMKKRIKVLYENGNSVMLTKVFESGSFTEVLKQVENVQTLHTYDRKQLEEYKKTKEKIAEMKSDLESDMEELKSTQSKFEKEKKELNATIESQKEKVENFDAKIQAAAQAAAQQTQRPSGGSTSGGNHHGGGNNYVPPANGGGGQAIVNAAMSFIGVPYVWGGESYSGVDCSGLVLMAHRAIGVRLDHYSGSQGSGGKAVPNMAAALPGDVVCYSGHVGVYIGGGQMVHAPDFGQTVKVSKVYGSPWFRRYW